MEPTAMIRIRLEGTPEENEMTVSTLRETMGDLLEMGYGARTWSFEMVDLTDKRRTRGPRDPRTPGLPDLDELGVTLP